MAENQMQRDDIVAAQTYVENRALPRLPEDYSEENLQKKFAKTMEELSEELNEYDEYRRELDAANKEQDEEQRIYSEEELGREYIELNRSRMPVQKEYDTAKKYADYLHEYGDQFAHLYRIKENNEIYGNPEKLDFVEVDITDNGDMLTQDQYFKMRADVDERVKQLALHVNDEENQVEYNIGMMVYDQPNQPPQVKMQLSFDEETLNNLDDEKLNAIFNFCDAHGLSAIDMEIRNFDGTLAESAIREKISKALEQRKADEAAKIAEENAKEYAAQKAREKELKAELQNISLAGDGHLPEGMVSEDDISYDLPEAEAFSTGDNVDEYADGNDARETAVAEHAPEQPAKIQRLARGVATAAVPDSDVPDNLDEHAPEENQSQINAAQSVSVPVQAGQQPPQSQNAPSSAPKVSKSKVLAKFDRYMEKGLEKSKGLSYWKTNTGWFGNGWTEYIVYDSEDPDHRSKDGLKGKDGTVKYTYSFKLFIKVDNDGGLHFAYRTPNHKKMDEGVLGGIVSQLDDLGYTAIRFPDGMPKDSETAMWRKAMAEKGIVPIGMSLDSKKVTGMLKAAGEKLTAEKLADYKYRLALQMIKHNKAKGKVVSESEQTFIEGLINGHRYAAFTDAYAKVLKSRMKAILRDKDPQIGAVKKVAAYRALLKTFEVYKSALEHGGDIMSATNLSNEEKAQLRDLTGPINKFSNRQMERIFDVLYNHDLDTKETEYFLRDELFKRSFGSGPNVAPHIALKKVIDEEIGCCDSINEDLSSLGIEEIKIIKIGNVRLDFKKFDDVYLPPYRQAQRNANTRGTTSNQQTVEGSFENENSSAAESRPSAELPQKSAPNKKTNAKADSAFTRNMVQNKGQVYH